jgi:hypothetical protein
VNQGIRRTFDINPDGVWVVVKWEDFVVGSSFFVPCINTKRCVQQVKDVVTPRGYDIVQNVTVENDRLGVRIWRLL